MSFTQSLNNQSNTPWVYDNNYSGAGVESNVNLLIIRLNMKEFCAGKKIPD
jgi:hypothetical protein